jgi:hypothetical protein
VAVGDILERYQKSAACVHIGRRTMTSSRTLSLNYGRIARIRIMQSSCNGTC